MGKIAGRLILRDVLLVVCGMLILLSGLIASVGGMLTSQGGSAPASVVCRMPSVDFGQVDQGEILRHTFIVENRGPTPVMFLKGLVSCGCTSVADIRGEVLNPHQTFKFPVHAETANKSGRFQGLVTLYYRGQGDLESDPSYYELTIQADIQPPLTPEPDELDFGQVGERSIYRTLRIHRRPGHQHGELSLHSSNSLFVVNQLGTESDEMVFRVTANPGEITEVRPDKAVSGFLYLTEDGRVVPGIRVPVRAVLAHNMTFSPSVIAIGAGSEGVVSKRIALESPRPFSVLSATSPDSRVVVSQVTNGVARRHAVEVSIGDLNDRNPIDTRIVIRVAMAKDTGAKGARIVSIPVLRLVKSERRISR